MKTWTTPVMQELDVRLTASSGDPAETEAGGFLGNGWIYATYDSATHEKLTDDATCTVPISDSARVDS